MFRYVRLVQVTAFVAVGSWTGRVLRSSALHERLGADAVLHCLAACSPLPSRKLANANDSLMSRGAGPQCACP